MKIVTATVCITVPDHFDDAEAMQMLVDVCDMAEANLDIEAYGSNMSKPVVSTYALSDPPTYGNIVGLDNDAINVLDEKWAVWQKEADRKAKEAVGGDAIFVSN